METISGYLYSQIIDLVSFSETTPNTENLLVYAKPLRIYKGVDNKIKFLIRNQDQKIQNLLYKQITFNLMDPTTSELVFSRTAIMSYDKKGQAYVNLYKEELNDVSAGNYYYSTYIVDGEGETAIIFTDLNYNAQGSAHVSDSVYPAFVPSFQPNLGPYNNNNPNVHGYSDVNQVFSDVINITDYVKSRAVAQTVQYYGTNFSGTVEVQASLEPIPNALPAKWATIYTETLSGFSGTNYFSFEGKYSMIRFHITTASGTLDKILYRP